MAWHGIMASHAQRARRVRTLVGGLLPHRVDAERIDGAVPHGGGSFGRVLVDAPCGGEDAERHREGLVVQEADVPVRWDGMGWDGMGWDGMGWDGMGWDGMGWEEM
jgi:hypothetical protein